ncbi:hypothetical protein CERSUDRAFT_119084 [Gelatoporia subvermispora B]|uniref:Uncharacterized protein n=1 Tax=Ceriporiopsis subvermispora (strain B) TaxID=914234 RepID=M2P9J2_CERS8|nr:hypothetical protein CERSUDRAFT_119084 [Gelatoporia subvermispora B]
MDFVKIKELGEKAIYLAIPTNTTIPTPTASATSATINALYHTEGAEFTATGKQQLRTGGAAIIAGDTPDVQTQMFLGDLTLSANAAATSLACGSILAGQTSETDEFGDVAFWLGEGPYGRGLENEVLKALGFGGRLPSVKMYPLDLFVQISRDQERSRDIVNLLSQLQDTYAFTAENMVSSALGDLVVYCLVGRVTGSGRIPGWAGLIGIGIMS